MPTVLVRDDFNGSGVLAGRTPDGINSGAWADDNWFWGGSAATQTAINGGYLKQTSAAATYGANVPLTGNPADAYIEARLLATSVPAAAVSTVSLGVRRVPASGVGVLCDFYIASATQIQVSIHGLGGGSGLFVVANVLNFVARMEIQGSVVKIYLDGTLVLTSTLTSPPAGGGRAYIDNNGNNTGVIDWVDYVEAGSMVNPPAPPFWTGFVGSYEIP